MATPYLQIMVGDVPSTQDFARERLVDLPVAVIASRQSAGRGRVGSSWMNADRALAVSFAWKTAAHDDRPFSLMAGVAATRAFPAVGLKWPNDVMIGEEKVGGILVERDADSTVAGLGLNLFWADAPPGFASLLDSDPGPDLHRQLGARWVAEFNELIDGEGWPAEAYRHRCVTLGKDIVWEPNGKGIAAGIGSDGALLVETKAGIEPLYSGVVRHVRG